LWRVVSQDAHQNTAPKLHAPYCAELRAPALARRHARVIKLNDTSLTQCGLDSGKRLRLQHTRTRRRPAPHCATPLAETLAASTLDVGIGILPPCKPQHDGCTTRNQKASILCSRMQLMFARIAGCHTTELRSGKQSAQTTAMHHRGRADANHTNGCCRCVSNAAVSRESAARDAVLRRSARLLRSS